MTRQKKEDEEELSPIEILEKKVFMLRILLIVAAFLAVAAIGSPLYLMRGMGDEIIAATTGPLSEMQSLESRVVGDFGNLHLALEFHNHQMDLFSDLISSIDPNIDREQFAVLQDIMLNQEEDYQYFLDTVKSAVFGLSEMVLGSRDWREDFNTKLDSAIAISQERELGIINLSRRSSMIDSDADLNSPIEADIEPNEVSSVDPEDTMMDDTAPAAGS